MTDLRSFFDFLFVPPRPFSYPSLHKQSAGMDNKALEPDSVSIPMEEAIICNRDGQPLAQPQPQQQQEPSMLTHLKKVENDITEAQRFLPPTQTLSGGPGVQWPLLHHPRGTMLEEERYHTSTIMSISISLWMGKGSELYSRTTIKVLTTRDRITSVMVLTHDKILTCLNTPRFRQQQGWLEILQRKSGASHSDSLCSHISLWRIPWDYLEFSACVLAAI